MDAKCPEARNPCGDARQERDERQQLSTRDKKGSDTERIDRLEKEVDLLRNDFDRIKWEQAVAEAAIGRAIIRGSASLGGNFGLVAQPSGGCHPSTRQKQLGDAPGKDHNSKMVMDSDKKTSAPKDKKKGDKEECGGFTLG